MINGTVMVRTYSADGRFYRSGWTTLMRLWDAGYDYVDLSKEGRSTLITKSGGIVEMILVD